MNEDVSAAPAPDFDALLRWVEQQSGHIRARLKIAHEQDQDEVWAETQVRAWRDMRRTPWPDDLDTRRAWLWRQAEQARADFYRLRGNARWRTDVTASLECVERQPVGGMQDIAWMDFLKRCAGYRDGLSVRRRAALGARLGLVSWEDAERETGLKKNTLRTDAAADIQHLRTHFGLAGVVLAWLGLGVWRVRQAGAMPVVAGGVGLGAAGAVALLLITAPVSGGAAVAASALPAATTALVEEPGVEAEVGVGVPVVRHEPARPASAVRDEPLSAVIAIAPAAPGGAPTAAAPRAGGGLRGLAEPATGPQETGVRGADARGVDRLRGRTRGDAAVRTPAVGGHAATTSPARDPRAVPATSGAEPASGAGGGLGVALGQFDEARAQEDPEDRARALAAFTQVWPQSTLVLDATLAEAHAWLAADAAGSALVALGRLDGHSLDPAMTADVLVLRGHALAGTGACSELRTLRKGATGATRGTLRALEGTCAPR
jgi:hypothetical protein